MTKLRGLATGIGSLPYPEAGAALDLIFQCTPQIPFWPQLPKRNAREGMLAQFSEGLPVLQAVEGLAADTLAGEDRRLEVFYEKIINQETDYFQISRNCAEGLYAFKERLEKEPDLLKGIEFIKGHITGPFTLAAAINDEAGRAYLNNPVFMQAFLKGLMMKGVWQVNFFKKFGKQVIIFIDEPYLGCFGSAYTPLERSQVIGGLSELAGGIKSAGALSGVHCCGNTDWSIFTDTVSLDIINFDAVEFLERFVLYAPNLQGFLRRGGLICWGIVPTQEPAGPKAASSLAERINQGIATLVKKGVDKELLEERLLISPACGLGSLAPQAAEEILRLLAEISIELKKN